MILEFDKSFEKSLDKIRDRNILQRVENVLVKFEKAKSIEVISNIKKLTGFSIYYRVKIGDYRLGFEKVNNETIRLIIIAHRKDIYNKFP